METSIAPAYNGTGGFVDRPASRERAVAEARSGKFSERATRVLETLHKCGPIGATWRELGDLLELHHGQISGSLSNLHKRGHVFMLKRTVKRCHVYVHSDFRTQYTAAEVYDLPAITQRTQRSVRDIAELVYVVKHYSYGYSIQMLAEKVADNHPEIAEIVRQMEEKRVI